MRELIERLEVGRRYLERCRNVEIRDDDVYWVLWPRSEAHDAGVTYATDPAVAAFDRTVLAQATQLVEAVGGTFAYDPGDPRRETIGPRPFPAVHWWWYLDEILAGTRERPSVP